jgi:membrane fusion protein (multidrug efflux system)
MEEKKKKKSIRVYIPLIIVVLVVLIAAVFWYRKYTSYISTDDAHVDTDNIAVSAKILGRIINIYADEGDTVTAGMLLTELDSSDLVAQKSRVMAMIGQSKANLAQAQAKYAFDQENIRIPEINYSRAQDDFNRAKSQFEGGIITQEQYDHSRSTYETANAQLQSAKTQLNVSYAQIESARAAVESANAELQVIESQLNNTKLVSPINGVIAKRWLLPGDVVQPGQSVFTVTNNHKLWIAVYLEETKITDVHLDQKVNFTIDAFPDVMFSGKVYSIGSNTASQFSLIPQNNASGNFTKVTQRIPLKISIEGTDNQESIASYNILAGMSVVVKILRDR